MPMGSQGQKRSADGIARAVVVGRIATGEIFEDKVPRKKTRANGRLARSERLLPTGRSEIARSAAKAHWADREGV
jgi:hypothetical protein